MHTCFALHCEILKGQLCMYILYSCQKQAVNLSLTISTYVACRVPSILATPNQLISESIFLLLLRMFVIGIDADIGIGIDAVIVSGYSVKRTKNETRTNETVFSRLFLIAN